MHNRYLLSTHWASLVAQYKKTACQCRRHKRHGFDPWVGKIPWRRPWQPTPVFLPGESRGKGTWWATVHGVTKSRTQSDLAHTHALETRHRVLPMVSEQNRNVSLPCTCWFWSGLPLITVCIIPGKPETRLTAEIEDGR